SGGMCFLNKEWYNDKSSGLLRDSWKSLDLVYVELTEIFRQNDPEFKHYCTNLRYRFLNEDTFQYLKKCNYLKDDAEIRNINPSLRMIKQITSSQDSRVGELLKKHKTLELLFMNHIQSEYVLRLRLNCRIMVIQNYSKSVVNRSSGVFIGWSTKIQSQKEKGDPVIRVKREYNYRNLDIDNGERYFDHDDNEKVYIRKQFLVIPFYAMTVYKFQGTTLKQAVVDLRGCSQKLAYTAVSRISTHDSLGVLNLTRIVYDRLTRTTKEDQ
ncbi:3042_t:CDS:2, partial [Racocetra persica]